MVPIGSHLSSISSISAQYNDEEDLAISTYIFVVYSFIYLSILTYHAGDVASSIKDMNHLYDSFMRYLSHTPVVWAKNNELVNQVKSLCKSEVVDKFADVTIVNDDGQVKIPKMWITLLKNEEILYQWGEIYRMTFVDWFLCVFTAGVYYFQTIHHKKFDRTALVVTNKRLVVVDIRQRAGTIPSHLGSFGICLRSFFPGATQLLAVLSKNLKKHDTIRMLTITNQLQITFFSYFLLFSL